jgi:hypothetical protein
MTGPILASSLLSLKAETLDWTERALLANHSRLRQYTRTEPAKYNRIRAV